MGRVSGTPRKVTLDGLTYDVAADTNITINLSPFEKEGVPTSGRTMFKMTNRVPTAESIPLIADPVEQDTVRQLAERLDSFPMSMTLADGSVYTTVGQINFENVETEENRASIIMIPDQSVGAWQLFAS